MKTNKYYFFLIGLFLILPIYGQEQVTVSGTVIDADTGIPIPGANILERGEANGAITDFDGEFTLTVSEDAVLEVSYLGYGSVEVEVDGRTCLLYTSPSPRDGLLSR